LPCKRKLLKRAIKLDVKDSITTSALRAPIVTRGGEREEARAFVAQGYGASAAAAIAFRRRTRRRENWGLKWGLKVPRYLPYTTSWAGALAEVRHRACHEGWCYPHVQAIIVSIDQYAEAALGNRGYFLNRPYGIGSSKGDVP
jgi:hypothetical protein